jgi:hypothetical protein
MLFTPDIAPKTVCLGGYRNPRTYYVDAIRPNLVPLLVRQILIASARKALGDDFDDLILERINAEVGLSTEMYQPEPEIEPETTLTPGTAKWRVWIRSKTFYEALTKPKTIKELARKFCTTEHQVRKDLMALEKRGFVTKRRVVNEDRTSQYVWEKTYP